MRPIYLEPDEEITSVVDKLSAISDREVAVVVPKNSALFQSLINLKLLKKEAEKQGKNVAIISSSKVGSRLVEQVGLKSYATLGAAGLTGAAAVADASAVKPPAPSETLPDGTRINQYHPDLPVGEEIAEPAIVTASAEDAAEEDVAKEPVVAQTADAPVKNEPEPSLEPVSLKSTPPEPATDSHELPAVPFRSYRQGTPLVIPWRSVVAAVAILLIAFFALAIFLPKALVTVTFPSRSISQTLALSASTVDIEGDTDIPATSITESKEDGKAIAATGKKDIGTKAGGEITITNKYRDGSGAGKDQTFAAGTKATDAKTKKVFTLNSSVTVGKVTYNTSNGQPIYQSQNVKVTAVEPGESYNIEPATFSVDGALAETTATSATAFSGGLTKQVTIITQEDLTKGMDELKKSVQTAALEAAKAKANNQSLIEGSPWIEVKKETVDKKAGDETESATASYAIDLTALTFDPALLVEKVKEQLGKGLSATEELALPESAPLVATYKTRNTDKTAFQFEVKAEGFATAKLDKNAMSKAIANKSADQAKAKLVADFGATDATITVTPSWWLQRLPFFGWAIKVEPAFTAASAPEVPAL